MTISTDADSSVDRVAYSCVNSNKLFLETMGLSKVRKWASLWNLLGSGGFSGGGVARIVLIVSFVERVLG
jgi:hypothetical protein